MAEANATPPAPRTGRLPLKTLIILAAVMLMEVATVLIVFALAGRPAPVSAQGTIAPEQQALEELVELAVVEDNFTNQKRGETYIYDTQVYVIVRRKHEVRVKADLAAMAARITNDIATVIGRAEPTHFAEPTLATLTRQIKAALDRRLGRDPADETQPIVQEVVIRRCIPYKVDV